jgi:AcrR family transcriptional regulator
LLVASNAEHWPAGRGRRRPLGADSAETRSRILRAARDVINERGYEAANFRPSPRVPGRPTMHYYFHTREDIHECLVTEAYSIVADCIAQAKREDTLLKPLSTFVAATHASGFADRSMVEDAIARGEIPGDTDPAAVVNMMLAMFVGICFTSDSLSIQTTCR